jgi:hypothetical protein
MPLQKNQYSILHIAKKQCGLSDDAYRMVLKNTGGAYSATQLDNASFERVMAVMESQGFIDSVHGAGYWTSKSGQRGSGMANERTVDHIVRLAKSCRYCVPAMCEKFSGGRTPYPEKLSSGEAWKLIEMMKAANGREAARQQKIMEDNRAQQALPF